MIFTKFLKSKDLNGVLLRLVKILDLIEKLFPVVYSLNWDTFAAGIISPLSPI